MQPNPYTGLFIALEGMDGAGKETQAINICLWLKERGFTVIKTQEPWNGLGSQTYERLDRIVYRKAEERSPEEIQYLFIDNRREHLEQEIEPNLAAGIAEVTERYAFSTVAYGAATSKVPIKTFLDKQDGFLFPDLTIILDLPVEIAISRLPIERHLFEKQDILRKVRSNYFVLANMFSTSGVRIVDGNKSPEEVFGQIIQYLELIIAIKHQRFLREL
ncbi:MAG: thymidylate kinase [Parcubacteria group bacterium GW2011_GWB1_40_14]|nr:MAG: thymidylate kinase [Parcubacteria group bacterium GW2011_GWB1_40_14]